MRPRSIGCAVVQIRAICRRWLDGWHTVRPTGAANARKRLTRGHRCERVSATLLDPVEEPAGPAP